MYDARFIAWETAWQMTVSAGKLRNEILTKLRNSETPMPDVYWAYLAEARIFADLARADTPVGLAAGDWLREESERAAEDNANHRHEMFENLMAEYEEDHE